jgi:hypothetical protein
MEREVFTNVEIAELMNRWFVNIKVDREERPDLDEIYMTATQVMTQHGGWPNSVFMTSDLKPFFAGTYFPPEDSFGRPGFPRVLTSINDAWTNRRPEVLKQADQITELIRRLQSGSTHETGNLDAAIVDQAIKSLRDRFDNLHAGFGASPKFPPDTSLDLLLAYYQTNQDSSLLNIVTATLTAMSAGGIHDHLGGGFHRYATDREWLIPHFEKMLYNQALLVLVYAKAFALTNDPEFADTAQDVLGYVTREMTGDHGGFYTALDAETDAIEGLYYLWHESDVRNLLGQDDETFFEHYALEPMPDEELGGVIHRLTPGTTETNPLLEKLLVNRSKRKRPRLDDKVIAGWNGLMIAAFAEAYATLVNPDYLESAVNAWRHLRSRQSTDDGRLYRTFREGVAKGEAYQEDYAFVVRGLLALHKATEDPEYLAEAIRLHTLADSLFWDQTDGVYFFTSGQEQLIVRQKDTRDSAIPSGNGEAVHNLLTLTELTGDPAYRYRAAVILNRLAAQMKANPTSHNRMILATFRYLQGERIESDVLTSKNVVSVSSEMVMVEEGSYRLEVNAIVRPGWHVNANPASDPNLIPTTLHTRKHGLSVGTVSYPDVKQFETGFSEETIDVYDGTIQIVAELEIEEGFKLEDALHLTVQACDETRCLLPSEIVLRPEELNRE